MMGRQQQLCQRRAQRGKAVPAGQAPRESLEASTPSNSSNKQQRNRATGSEIVSSHLRLAPARLHCRHARNALQRPAGQDLRPAVKRRLGDLVAGHRRALHRGVGCIKTNTAFKVGNALGARNRSLVAVRQEARLAVPRGHVNLQEVCVCVCGEGAELGAGDA